MSLKCDGGYGVRMPELEHDWRLTVRFERPEHAHSIFSSLKTHESAALVADRAKEGWPSARGNGCGCTAALTRRCNARRRSSRTCSSARASRLRSGPSIGQTRRPGRRSSYRRHPSVTRTRCTSITDAGPRAQRPSLAVCRFTSSALTSTRRKPSLENFKPTAMTCTRPARSCSSSPTTPTRPIGSARHSSETLRGCAAVLRGERSLSSPQPLT
jgi:hypothetical protein